MTALRSCTLSFRQYVAANADRGDFVGLFCADAVGDKQFPWDLMRRWADLEAYLQGCRADAWALEAARRCWFDWQRDHPPGADWFPFEHRIRCFKQARRMARQLGELEARLFEDGLLSASDTARYRALFEAYITAGRGLGLFR